MNHIAKICSSFAVTAGMLLGTIAIADALPLSASESEIVSPMAIGKWYRSHVRDYSAGDYKKCQYEAGRLNRDKSVVDGYYNRGYICVFERGVVAFYAELRYNIDR